VVILWILIPLISFLFPPRRHSGGGQGWGWNFEDLLDFAITPLFNSQPIQYAALLIALLAFLLTLLCWKKMGISWRMGIDPTEKTQLITTGPYSRIRHPIYALSSLLMLATVAAIPSPAMLLVAATHLFLLQLEARREESYLAITHGPAYSEYQRRTGRFIPKLI
jgi:protein-S-isoprenylcysteine O-methyltransferase Ste14